MKEINVKAYAKINLFLNITSVMENGFHEIDSVMQTVSLADELCIRVYPSETNEITVNCDSPYAPKGSDNIVYRAADRFLERTGRTARMEISLKKNIPSPAGMGGGSADAAAVLRGLSRLLDVDDRELLFDIGEEIGSDVPFCISGGTCITKGRGERLSECQPMADCFIVVGCGGDKMPTPRAFRLLDEKFDRFMHKREIAAASRLSDALGNARELGDSLYNIFEEVTAEECPSVNELKAIMLDGGALGALMSGSGPSVFGIFEDEIKAQAVTKKIMASGSFAAVCRPQKRYF